MNTNLAQFAALTGGPNWLTYGFGPEQTFFPNQPTLAIPDLGAIDPLAPLPPLTASPTQSTEGRSGAQPGPGGVGAPLGRGEADIGYTRGEATADTTTTATDSFGDFLSSLSVGLFGGPLSQFSYAMFGQTPMGLAFGTLKDIAMAEYDRAMGNSATNTGGLSMGDLGFGGPAGGESGRDNDPGQPGGPDF
jgi:hypothetical protein